MFEFIGMYPSRTLNEVLQHLNNELYSCFTPLELVDCYIQVSITRLQDKWIIVHQPVWLEILLQDRTHFLYIQLNHTGQEIILEYIQTGRINEE